MQKGIRTGEFRSCEVCGSVFYAHPYRVKRGNATCCSRACGYIARTGKEYHKPVEERFWEKVEKRKPSECWPWVGATITGYGCFRFEGRTQIASRVAYRLAHGDFDQSLNVLHSCDSPICCNPAHLRLGTQTDNAVDMLTRGRGRWNPPRGERAGAAKLTEAKVRRIRALAADGMSLADIGRKYKITKQSVWFIVKRINWAHVNDANGERGASG